LGKERLVTRDRLSVRLRRRDDRAGHGWCGGRFPGRRV